LKKILKTPEITGANTYYRDYLETIISGAKPEEIKLTGLKGTSMHPLLVYGDRIDLEYDVERENLKDRDIVVCVHEPDKKIYLHRYFKGKNRTKGDAFYFYDPKDLRVVSRVKKINPGLLHIYYRYKYSYLYGMPKEILFAVDVVSDEINSSDSQLCFDDFNYYLLFEWLGRHNLMGLFLSNMKDLNFIPESFRVGLREIIKDVDFHGAESMKIEHNEFYIISSLTSEISAKKKSIVASLLSEEKGVCDEIHLCLLAINLFADLNSSFYLLLRAYCLLEKRELNIERLKKVTGLLTCKKRIEWFLYLMGIFFRKSYPDRLCEKKTLSVIDRIIVGFWKNQLIGWNSF